MADEFFPTERSGDAVLIELQKPTSAPESSNLEAGTNLMLAPTRTLDHTRNFPPETYDLGAQTHLARFLKVLLGDSGAGQVKKRYSLARMEATLWSTYSTDLDRLYGNLFGFRRLLGETQDVLPYTDLATADQWEEACARDASYRSRIEQFSRSLGVAPTTHGVEQIAEALLSVDCDVYETYTFVDENGGSNPGGAPSSIGARTYVEVEDEYTYYGPMEGGTYADVEGGHGTFGRTTSQNRKEFVVRPKRPISLEETYELTRVLNALKPADALLTINPEGVVIHRDVLLRGVAADSEHWEVSVRVAPRKEVERYYTAQATFGAAVAQPRPAFVGYQGEAWTYNADIVSVGSYTETTPGVTGTTRDYQRVVYPDGRAVDYAPERGVADPQRIQMGRAASDAMLVAAPYAGPRAGVLK